MTTNVLLVGCGNMGFAMLEGWTKLGGDMQFHVIEPNDDLRERARSVGASVSEGLDESSGNAAFDLIFYAVKPQVMDQIVPAYLGFSAATHISVAAGVTVASLNSWLGGDAPIIRCMPNTPASIGQGMMVSFANEKVSQAARNAVQELLGASGETGWVDDEGLMDAVTAISGSGPAYIFHFIECLADAARALGIAGDLAEKLAMQTVAGAGQLARSSEDEPSVLRQKVTSPGGTTAAALDVFMGRLGPLVEEAATAARDRGAELGRS